MNMTAAFKRDKAVQFSPAPDQTYAVVTANSKNDALKLVSIFRAEQGSRCAGRKNHP